MQHSLKTALNSFEKLDFALQTDWMSIATLDFIILIQILDRILQDDSFHVCCDLKRPKILASTGRKTSLPVIINI
jgi:hypothetical protein